MTPEERERLGMAESDISDIKIRVAVAESNIKSIQKDIGDIKNNTTWIIRLMMGAIIMAILGLVLSGGGA